MLFSTTLRNSLNHANLENRKICKPMQKRNNTNNITSLKVGAGVTTKEDVIISDLEKKLPQLYNSKKKASFEIFLDHLNECKTKEINEVKEMNIDEQFKANNKLNAERSSVLDGITSNFYL